MLLRQPKYRSARGSSAKSSLGGGRGAFDLHLVCDLTQGLIQPQGCEHVRNIRGIGWHDVRTIDRHLRIHILALDGEGSSVVDSNSSVLMLVS